jgi:hypothetical protein
MPNGRDGSETAIGSDKRFHQVFIADEQEIYVRMARQYSNGASDDHVRSMISAHGIERDPHRFAHFCGVSVPCSRTKLSIRSDNGTTSLAMIAGLDSSIVAANTTLDRDKEENFHDLLGLARSAMLKRELLQALRVAFRSGDAPLPQISTQCRKGVAPFPSRQAAAAEPAGIAVPTDGSHPLVESQY